ncbi:MAG: bacteriohemerythrin [Deferrisomatales bacterium]
MPEWSPLMGVGVQEIDEGHRELVEQLGELGLAMKRGRGRERLAELLRFLRLHADEHFAAEEELMARHGYPDRAEHQARHEAFRAELAAREEVFSLDPDTPGVVTEIHGWILRWLSHHEIAADAPLGEYLRQAGVRP